MADELRTRPPSDARGEMPPAIHARAFVIRPAGPLGKLALAAVLVGAGALFFTLGLALLATLAVAATATGLGVVAYRVLGGKPAGKPAGPAAPPRLDPAKEIFLTKPEN